MRYFTSLKFLITSVFLIYFIEKPLYSLGLDSDTSIFVSSNQVDWECIDSGLYFSEIQGPQKTLVGDYKVQMIKIDPSYYSFDFILASQFDSIEQPAPEWCFRGEFIGVINAGMYHFNKELSPVGFLKNNDTLFQPNFKDGHNMIVAFNKTNEKNSDFLMNNYDSVDFLNVQANYKSCFQSIRMISDVGNPIYWKSKPEKRMSMSVLAIDEMGNVLFIFSRSPYSANEMTDLLINQPLKIKRAMYLEGGPEASLYLEHNDFCIQKFGSYVSYSFAHDRNDHYWAIPNMLGFKKKKQ